MHNEDTCDVCRMIGGGFVDDRFAQAMAVNAMEAQMKESDPGIYDAGLLKFWEAEAKARELLFALQEEQRRYYPDDQDPTQY